LSDVEEASGRDAVVAILAELSAELEEGRTGRMILLDAILKRSEPSLGRSRIATLTPDCPVPKDPWELIGRALKGARNYE